MDPRLAVVDNRLRDVKRLIAISGGKGGIGKSSVASVLALVLSDLGYKVGLMDLDFSGPSTHIILGIKGISPQEEKGIIPPEIHGVKFMSITYYSGDNPSPMRGIDISNAIMELFAITCWGSLDFLIIDMPPGIGDTTLDMIRLIKRIEFLIITTPSKVAFETVRKSLKMLEELNVPIVGIVENMKISDSSYVKEQIGKFNLPILGEIGRDDKLDDCTGNVSKLSETRFARDIRKIAVETTKLNIPEDIREQ